MLRLYSPARAERILRRRAEEIAAVSARYAVPEAVLKAILYKELTEIDFFDLLADLAAGFYWLRYALRGAEPRLTRGVFGKRDSSTGHTQIFGRVALRALLEARAHGLPLPEGSPDPDAPDAVGQVWRRLRRDPRFNLDCCALNLLSAAEEMTGRYGFEGCTGEELKRILTRYNADTRSVTPYGEAAYGHYLRYLSAGSP